MVRKYIVHSLVLNILEVNKQIKIVLMNYFLNTIILLIKQFVSTITICTNILTNLSLYFSNVTNINISIISKSNVDNLPIQNFVPSFNMFLSLLLNTNILFNIYATVHANIQDTTLVICNSSGLYGSNINVVNK